MTPILLMTILSFHSPVHAVQKSAAPRGLALVYGVQNRRLAKDFAPGQLSAAQVEERYAATGDITCAVGKLQGNYQGQVTVKSDLVTSNAHVIHEINCRRPSTQLKSCRFQIKVAGKLQTYGFKEIVEAGYACPQKREKIGRDWIIFRLDRPVDPRVRPYPLVPAGQAMVGQSVVLVTKSGDWPKTYSGSLAGRPRHYADCEIKKLPSLTKSSIQTNCATSEGSSGGSLLTAGDAPGLVAVHSSAMKPDNKPECDQSPLVNGEGPFQEDCWGSAMVPIEGDFYQALLRATGS